MEVIPKITQIDILSESSTLSWRGPQTYKNYSIGLHSKSMDWFLYGRDLLQERFKGTQWRLIDEGVNPSTLGIQELQPAALFKYV